MSVIGMMVKTFVDFSESSAADAFADLHVVTFDPVFVAAEDVLLKRNKTDDD